MMQTEILAIALGLGSAAAWGAGDFSGGCASRKGNLLGVILISQFGGKPARPLSGQWVFIGMTSVLFVVYFFRLLPTRGVRRIRHALNGSTE